MHQFYHHLYQSLREGRELVIATIIDNSGSTPRGSGSKMAIYADGSLSGTIGGGAVEGDVIQRGLHLFDGGGAQIMTYDLNTKSLVEGMDLICGGQIRVLTEYVAANTDNLSIYQCLIDEMARSKPAFLVAGVRQVGDRLHVARSVYTSDDQWRGVLPQNHDLEVVLEKEKILLNTSSLIEHDDIFYVIEKIEPPDTIYLVGGGHVAKEISVIAGIVGFQTIVFDDRAEFANKRRFATAAAVHVSPGFDDIFRNYTIHDTSYVVIVTRGHRYDREVLAQALRTDAGYIGMIGSRKKRASIYKSLIEEGFTPDELEKVFCPIGLPIHAETPAEIGVSVVAQLIQHKAGRTTDG